MFRRIAAVSLILVLASCDSGESEAKWLAAAQARLDKQDVPGAVIELKNALNQNAGSGSARLLMGKALLMAGDPKGAVLELRKAQQAGVPEGAVMPELGKAMLAAGEARAVVSQLALASVAPPSAAADLKATVAAAHMALGQPDLARAAAQEALQQEAEHVPAQVLLARLDASQGKSDQALERLATVLGRVPGNELAGLAQGDILLQARQDLGAASAAWRAVLSSHPKSVQAHQSLTDALLQQGKPDEAKAQWALLNTLAPAHPDTLYLRARIAYQDKDFAACRDVTQRLLAALPENPRVLLLAGLAEQQLQRYGHASVLLAKAVKLAPDALVARHALAQVFLQDGLPEKAAELLAPVLEGADTDATSLVLAGQAYLQSGDPARSETSFQRALKLKPGDSRAKVALAMASVERGDVEQGLGKLEQLAKVDNSATVDMALLGARLRTGDLKGALLAAQALERKLPDQPFAATQRGRLLAQQGDLPSAKAAFERALQLHKHYFPAIEGMLALDLREGRPEAARKRLEALLKDDPKSARARHALVLVDERMGAPESQLIEGLREASRLDPTLAAPRLALVERLLLAGEAAAALNAARDASAALPSDAAILDALGRALLATGDGQQAISTYKRLMAQQPGQAAHALRLADAYLAVKNLPAAATALKQAKEIEPDNRMAQRGLALMAMMDKRPDDALALARALQKRHPKEAFGFVLEGELQRQRPNLAAAAAAYAAALRLEQSPLRAVELHRSLIEAGHSEQAGRMAADWLKAHPQDAQFQFHLGDLAMSARDWATAEGRYRAVLELQPKQLAALNNLAWLLATQGKPGAVAFAEKALALRPDRAAVLDTLAMAQASENQLPQAVKTQKRAVELNPRDPELRLNLARLLVKQGEKTEARKELEALTRLGERFVRQAEVADMLKTL